MQGGAGDTGQSHAYDRPGRIAEQGGTGTQAGGGDNRVTANLAYKRQAAVWRPVAKARCHRDGGGEAGLVEVALSRR